MFPKAFAVAALLAVAASASAQTPPPASEPVVVTSGEAVVKRAPDRAFVSIAAESRAKTSRDAQKLNAEAMTSVLGKLKSSGIPGDAIQTTGYDIQPEFDYANGKQTVRGYVARNSIEVRVDELPKLKEHLTADILPILATLDRVGPDLHDLLDVTRDLKLAVAGIPGLGMLRRRGEKLTDDAAN